jgi:prepilin peptidase CpaA
MPASTFVADFEVVCFAALVFWAAVSDILTFRIPNRLALAVALLYPAYVFAAPVPVDWLSAAGLAGATLIVGFFMYSRRYCGAGDVKLFAAVTLWGGPQLFFPFLFVTTLAGGVIALFIWLQHRFAQAPSLVLALQTASDPLIGKQQMPYGAAIAVAALYVAFTLLRLK